jgi:hypothetical protein
MNAGGRMDDILKYVLDAWRRQLEPLLTPLWDSAGLWRTLVLGFVTALVMAWRARDRLRGWLMQPTKRQRDRQIFRQANAILPESELYDLLTQLERGQAVKLERLVRFIGFLGAAGNQFFSGSVPSTVAVFLETARELESLLSQPVITPNPDELGNLAHAVERTYRAFRNAVRETLIV